MDERFDFAGLSIPCRVCRERLEAVAQRAAPVYQCSPHAALGMLLLKATRVIGKAECSLGLCRRGQDCSIHRTAAREQ